MQQFKELKGEDFQEDISDCDDGDLFLNNFPLSGRGQKANPQVKK